jgi:hypothetical protein
VTDFLIALALVWMLIVPVAVVSWAAMGHLGIRRFHVLIWCGIGMLVSALGDLWTNDGFWVPLGLSGIGLLGYAVWDWRRSTRRMPVERIQ